MNADPGVADASLHEANRPAVPKPEPRTRTVVFPEVGSCEGLTDRMLMMLLLLLMLPVLPVLEPVLEPAPPDVLLLAVPRPSPEPAASRSSTSCIIVATRSTPVRAQVPPTRRRRRARDRGDADRRVPVAPSFVSKSTLMAGALPALAGRINFWNARPADSCLTPGR